jgi:hypothetical protein
VGSGSGHAAQGSGPNSSAAGSFDGLAGVTSESANVGGLAPAVANAFTLQLNTNQFTTAICNGAANPANCLGWQQFVFSNTQCNSGPCIFIEYWLLNYGTRCPTGWTQTSQGCYVNKGATTVPAQRITDLSQITLTGKIAGGTDTLVLSTATGDLSATAQDSILNLGQNWTSAEFGIFGDCCFSQASFNDGSTIIVRLSIDDGTSNAPSCASGSSFNGWTGETNNLNLVDPCCPHGGSPHPSC